MRISFQDLSARKLPSKGAVILFTNSKKELGVAANALNQKTKKLIDRALKNSSFAGKAGELLPLVTPMGTNLTRILLVGLGKTATLKESAFEKAVDAAISHMQSAGEKEVAIAIDEFKGSPVTADRMAALAGYNAQMTTYVFDKYLTKKKSKKPKVQTVAIWTPDVKAARLAYKPLSAIADGAYLARDLMEEPGNVIYPETLKDAIMPLKDIGIKVEVLNEAQMKKLGMGALLGVAQGSSHKPYLVVMQWEGGDKKDKPIAMVGKGVTFDTGGYSIKPADGMEEMKADMGGAAVVIGTMKALALRQARVNAVGVVGLVENMVSGDAQRPGDIVKTMSGQTIEVLNTDAEGRLVLADALWYTQDRFKPQYMVDFATLTGAIIIALGHSFAGLFSNDDLLSEQLTAAGQHAGERLWRMPLDTTYDRAINSKSADMKNIGGRAAGSITAAQLLQRFTNKTKWAHIDIAGVAGIFKDPSGNKPALAFGVRLMNQWLMDHYEA